MKYLSKIPNSSTVFWKDDLQSFDLLLGVKSLAITFLLLSIINIIIPFFIRISQI